MKKWMFLILLGGMVLVSGCVSQESIGTFTLEEISQHNIKNDCWLLIHEKVYDVTPYLSEHPGGIPNITINCGTDSTDEFELKPTGRTHSGNARTLLEKYYIGDLASQYEELKTSVVAYKTDEPIVVDGIVDSVWEKASETLFMAETRKIKVRALNNGTHISILTKVFDDDENADSSNPTDRVAVQFDISGDSEVHMGAAGVPHIKESQPTIGIGTVDIWHWKAFDSHTNNTDMIDDEFAGPEAPSDHYYREDDGNMGGHNDLIAHGIYYADKQEWVVEFSRVLITQDKVDGFTWAFDKDFETDKSYKIAFANWDGGLGEDRGEHKSTDWGILEIKSSSMG